MAVLIFWGIVVVGDSPQFSALNARYAPPRLVGSALTIVNCIGFAITILSIQLLKGALPIVGAQYLFLLLIPGPLLGLLAGGALFERSSRARCFVLGRQPPMGREVIDDSGQILPQCVEQLNAFHARPLGEGVDGVLPESCLQSFG